MNRVLDYYIFQGLLDCGFQSSIKPISIGLIHFPNYFLAGLDVLGSCPRSRAKPGHPEQRGFPTFCCFLCGRDTSRAAPIPRTCAWPSQMSWGEGEHFVVPNEALCPCRERAASPATDCLWLFIAQREEHGEGLYVILEKDKMP